MYCQYCKSENSDDAHFCLSCGKSLELTKFKLCDACGSNNPIEAKFCTNCGKLLNLVNESKTSQDIVAPLVDLKLLSKRPKPQKFAAICVWVVCLVAFLVALTLGSPNKDEMNACIARGGSGSTCPGMDFSSMIIILATIAGAGYGKKLWSGKLW